ncbi:MAG TPA: glutamate synthase large subunit [Dissulfurispiraceae bacterium]|nr:glutamate synthase large subunit [Dissulfurispiraceae bacterium]
MRDRYLSSCGVGFVCNIHGKRSNQIVRWGIEAVKNLTHRGAVGSDGKTGDGAGILIEIPRRFFSRKIAEFGISVSHVDNLAVGSFFLYGNVEDGIEEVLQGYGFRPIGWLDVRTDDDALGRAALLTKPRIRQLLIDTVDVAENKREIKLFFSRKEIEKRFGSDVCVSNISSRTLLYKGLLVAPQLDRFYPDLQEEDIESSFCIFHQRFSTNTLPEWVMAQPFRVLAHNGEINTVQGNRNAIRALEKIVLEEFGEKERAVISPLVADHESDSASLDRIVELLILSGYPPEFAVNLCIPPAWEYAPLPSEQKDLLHYFSLMMTPWDGPAAVVFTDGSTIGAHLDRNGLRPLRYALTDEGTVIAGSEAGMIDMGAGHIIKKGRLGPGDTIAVRLGSGVISETAEILAAIAVRQPYSRWLQDSLVNHKRQEVMTPSDNSPVVQSQIFFGYTKEELEAMLFSMAETGAEMTFSMGDDTPLPPLSEKPPLLFRYFKQRFSQITNPSIDPIREKMVMSLAMHLGPRMSFLTETAGHARRYCIQSPLLFEGDLQEIESRSGFAVKRLPITYDPAKDGLAAAIAALRHAAIDAVSKGAEILILTDCDISAQSFAIPSLLAVSSVFRELLNKNCGHCASIIVETGEARDVHHIACLIGFGAAAVHPWLIPRTVSDLCARKIISRPFEMAMDNYRRAIEEGLLKVLGRLGISTLDSYYSAQLFDIICLNKGVVEEYLGQLPTSMEADGRKEIEEAVRKRHYAAYSADQPLVDAGGTLKYRKDGEDHAWASPTVAALNRFVRLGKAEGYRSFASAAEGRPVYARHVLGYRAGKPVPVEDVETEESIIARFVSGAMSVGSLSPEAHETIAEACNRLGMRSNSGEGGEDPARYGTSRNSAIKQVASGRFGVTPAYLASAKEIEIKVAQGAKPGEGGHLPSSKVTDYIARLRYCKPGTLLISPPPHHDIYSIEDLNQLIHDLKQANPEARVCVKLVSEVGVGTVAAGVAKAYADIIQISGYEGGTGASPITSIKNVGNYWEIGLSETQRVLIENGLRDRVTLRVDGGLRTGKDVILAALFGAEEYGFGTATMVAAGCIMARQCHMNTCPTGIATQDERLRAKFRGTPEGVMDYFRAVARDVRAALAEMGFRSIADIVGRTDLVVIEPDDRFTGSRRLRLTPLLQPPPETGPRMGSGKRNDNPGSSLNDKLTADLSGYIDEAKTSNMEYNIRNTDRSVPTRLAYLIAKRYGADGLSADTVNLVFRGTAGQSFGAFNHKGMSLTLIGEANDYAGKGMHGGVIAIRPDEHLRYPHRQVIVGNTVLYGATGGSFYAAGIAGERFGVRNSGAVAVVEGAGQHCCEYMTRGEVAVLGDTGINVGAGMTGGVIYMMDCNGGLDSRLNSAYVKSLPLDNGDRLRLKELMKEHQVRTGSPLAGSLLANFDEKARQFRKVLPNT